MLFDELVSRASPAYATADFDGGSDRGRVTVILAGSLVSVVLGQLPDGAVAGLSGGRLRYRDVATKQPVERGIVSADMDGGTGLLALVLDAVARPGDGDDVAVIWPGA